MRCLVSRGASDERGCTEACIWAGHLELVEDKLVDLLVSGCGDVHVPGKCTHFDGRKLTANGHETTKLGTTELLSNGWVPTSICTPTVRCLPLVRSEAGERLFARQGEWRVNGG